MSLATAEAPSTTLTGFDAARLLIENAQANDNTVVNHLLSDSTPFRIDGNSTPLIDASVSPLGVDVLAVLSPVYDPDAQDPDILMLVDMRKPPEGTTVEARALRQKHFDDPTTAFMLVSNGFFREQATKDDTYGFKSLRPMEPEEWGRSANTAERFALSEHKASNVSRHQAIVQVADDASSVAVTNLKLESGTTVITGNGQSRPAAQPRLSHGKVVVGALADSNEPLGTHSPDSGMQERTKKSGRIFGKDGVVRSLANAVRGSRHRR